MTVEQQLREYRSTLDVATESAAAAAANRVAPHVRVRPARSLVLAAVAVAAVVAVAFAAVGLSRHGATPPAGTGLSTSVPPPTTVGPPSRTVVPDVVGMSTPAAVSMLENFGFHATTKLVTRCVAVGLVVAESPAPGTRVPRGATVGLSSCIPASATTTTLQLFGCSTRHGIPPSSTPARPTSIVVTKPPFASPGLAGFTDADGRLVTTAPPFWGCQALDATDGGASIDLTLPDTSTTPAYKAGRSPNPGVDGVFAISIPACQGCVYAEICAVVPSAAADFPIFARSGLCRTPPAGERATARGGNVYVIADPAGTLGPDPARSILRYRPKTSTTDASVVRETCILPASDRTVCDTLLDEFLALNP